MHFFCFSCNRFYPLEGVAKPDVGSKKRCFCKACIATIKRRLAAKGTTDTRPSQRPVPTKLWDIPVVSPRQAASIVYRMRKKAGSSAL